MPTAARAGEPLQDVQVDAPEDARQQVVEHQRPGLGQHVALRGPIDRPRTRRTAVGFRPRGESPGASTVAQQGSNSQIICTMFITSETPASPTKPSSKRRQQDQRHRARPWRPRSRWRCRPGTPSARRRRRPQLMRICDVGEEAALARRARSPAPCSGESWPTGSVGPARPPRSAAGSPARGGSAARCTLIR